MSLAHGNTHNFYSPPKLQKLEQEKMKRIKIFLGGYVNYLNAQNINCRSLSEHLDQNKFNISTSILRLMRLTFVKLPGLNIYNYDYRRDFGDI